MSASRVMIALPEHSAIPDELLGLRVDVRHIVGSDLQVRMPAHGDSRALPSGSDQSRQRVLAACAGP
jgi:hypothetical protein